MADLARGKQAAAIKTSAKEQSGSQAVSGFDVHEVVAANARSRARLSERSQVGIILKKDRDTKGLLESGGHLRT